MPTPSSYPPEPSLDAIGGAPRSTGTPSGLSAGGARPTAGAARTPPRPSARCAAPRS